MFFICYRLSYKLWEEACVTPQLIPVVPFGYDASPGVRGSSLKALRPK